MVANEINRPSCHLFQGQGPGLSTVKRQPDETFASIGLIWSRIHPECATPGADSQEVLHWVVRHSSGLEREAMAHGLQKQDTPTFRTGPVTNMYGTVIQICQYTTRLNMLRQSLYLCNPEMFRTQGFFDIANRLCFRGWTDGLSKRGDAVQHPTKGNFFLRCTFLIHGEW